MRPLLLRWIVHLRHLFRCSVSVRLSNYYNFMIIFFSLYFHCFHFSIPATTITKSKKNRLHCIKFEMVKMSLIPTRWSFITLQIELRKRYAYAQAPRQRSNWKIRAEKIMRTFLIATQTENVSAFYSCNGFYTRKLNSERIENRWLRCSA